MSGDKRSLFTPLSQRQYCSIVIVGLQKNNNTISSNGKIYFNSQNICIEIVFLETHNQEVNSISIIRTISLAETGLLAKQHDLI